MQQRTALGGISGELRSHNFEVSQQFVEADFDFLGGNREEVQQKRAQSIP